MWGRNPTLNSSLSHVLDKKLPSDASWIHIISIQIFLILAIQISLISAIKKISLISAIKIFLIAAIQISRISAMRIFLSCCQISLTFCHTNLSHFCHKKLSYCCYTNLSYFLPYKSLLFLAIQVFQSYSCCTNLSYFLPYKHLSYICHTNTTGFKSDLWARKKPIVIQISYAQVNSQTLQLQSRPVLWNNKPQGPISPTKVNFWDNNVQR